MSSVPAKTVAGAFGSTAIVQTPVFCMIPLAEPHQGPEPGAVGVLVLVVVVVVVPEKAPASGVENFELAEPTVRRVRLVRGACCGDACCWLLAGVVVAAVEAAGVLPPPPLLQPKIEIEVQRIAIDA